MGGIAWRFIIQRDTTRDFGYIKKHLHFLIILQRIRLLRIFIVLLQQRKISLTTLRRNKDGTTLSGYGNWITVRLGAAPNMG
jgi:hypothetical protein